MKRKRAIICLVLFTFCTAFMSGAWKQNVSALTLDDITSDSIKEKEEQINQAKEEKKNLQNNLSNLKDMKKELEAQRANLADYIAQLDSNLAEIERNIEVLKQKISVKEAEIEETERELEQALENEENQKEAMITRIRMVYESGDPQMTDMLLKAESFGDFLNKADYAERVISYDRQRWQDYMSARKYVELCKEKLEIEKEVLDEAKAAVEEEQRNLEILIAEKTQEIERYENDITMKEVAIKEYEASIKAEEEEIAALETLVAEEKKALLAASGVVLTYDGGAFKFPLASYTRVSSEYGYRIHPILNVQQFHNGVDLAAPKGTAIYAAYDGTVVAATYSSTMGNYVMIDHGSGLYTIYMHASALYVNKGDIVIRGETIAAVGSTGRSTGNHLHFSVRLNGSYVSPWDYISR
ncbi:MAG: murein hydrolase activator EnvC family protein [Acetatifactor sp.]